MGPSVAKLASHDRVWQSIRQSAAAMVAEEPILASLVHASVLNQLHFEDALNYILAQCLGTAEAPAILLHQSFDELTTAHPDVGAAARADLAAVCERDPACRSPLEALLFFKGYHAIQTYRLAHALLNKGRRPLALHLQNRMALTFGVDINPAARLGRGIMIDHGTGVVIGETAVVEDGVSILQGVTLGGTGKDEGDRHPKIRRGVMIGAGACILGNIEIGARAKIGAGSVVLQNIPPGCTAAGVPARIIGRCANTEPARDMDQGFDDVEA
ncbi:serine O-acetyltransferase [uncultured Bradyrhizobium sp.]|uniref:serine O-acetyltransferase n=1 Tax=uncultured Bradyrhizobium sp. TaxID=199684 RepID=UPI0035CBEE66